jgi:hypothetical protein
VGKIAETTGTHGIIKAVEMELSWSSTPSKVEVGKSAS